MPPDDARLALDALRAGEPREQNLLVWWCDWLLEQKAERGEELPRVGRGSDGIRTV